MAESLVAGEQLIRREDSPMISGAPGASSYALGRVSLADATEPLLSEWQGLHDLSSPDLPMTGPEWLRGFLAAQAHEVSVYSLRDAERLTGIAAFLRVDDWDMKWHLGELTVARLPLRRLKLISGEPIWPDQQVAYDLLFTELAGTSGFDALYLEEIPISSYLWKYVHESDLIRRNFLLYEPDAPAPRLFLRPEGSFEQYLRTFSHKHRGELSRRVRRLRESTLGEMRFVRYESAEQVPEFLHNAVAVSKTTYQWKLHQRGLSDAEMIEKQLMHDAERGWLRSYVLYCGDRPCAFRMGFQYRGRFLSHEIGFDPEFSRYSVGTVLQYLTIQDLFEYQRPTYFDFQDYGAYKETWATESFLQGKCYLFRRNAYGRLCCAGDRVCRSTNKAMAALLERSNIKTELKKWMRGWKRS